MVDRTLPFVSIIMPIRNEAGFIERAIQSILNNNYPPDRMEIIIVDGCSDDDTQAIVQKMAAENSYIKLLDNPAKIQAAAMNIGIKACRGEVFIRIDGHTEIPTDFIKKSIRCLAEHPEAWIAGGYIKTVGLNYISRVVAAAMSSPIGVGNARFRLGPFEGYVDTVAFGAHYKWIVDKIGYFDEELPFNEDDEFNLRVLLGGGKIWMSKDIWSRYFARGSLRKLWLQYFRYGFGRIRALQKHKRPAVFRQIVPLLFICTLFVLALAGVVWQIFWWILAAILGIYALALTYGSIQVGRQTAWRCFFLAPLVFAILHFSYGLGNLAGIWRFVIRRDGGLKPASKVKISH